MDTSVFFQMIPILALGVYVIYLSYYYAAPTFWLKVMMFYAHIRHPGIDIRFVGAKATVTIIDADGEHVLERPLEVDLSSRFLASHVCAVFRGMLRDIRKETCLISDSMNEGGAEHAENGLRTGQGPGRPGRQGTEEDRD